MVAEMARDYFAILIFGQNPAELRNLSYFVAGAMSGARPTDTAPLGIQMIGPVRAEHVDVFVDWISGSNLGRALELRAVPVDVRRSPRPDLRHSELCVRVADELVPGSAVREVLELAPESEVVIAARRYVGQICFLTAAKDMTAVRAWSMLESSRELLALGPHVAAPVFADAVFQPAVALLFQREASEQPSAGELEQVHVRLGYEGDGSGLGFGSAMGRARLLWRSASARRSRSRCPHARGQGRTRSPRRWRWFGHKTAGPPSPSVVNIEATSFGSPTTPRSSPRFAGCGAT